MGSVSTADGSVNMYAINGEYLLNSWASVPVVGTGHLDPNTGAFHYSVSGAFFDSDDVYSFVFEDYLDPSADPQGYITAYAGGSYNGTYGWQDSYTPSSCTGMTIPYSAKGGQKSSLAEALKACTEAFKALGQSLK